MRPALAEAEALYSLGAFRFDTGDLEGAREALRRCVAMEPAHPLAHAVLAELAIERRDDASAAYHISVMLRSSSPGLENIRRRARTLWARAAAGGVVRRPGCGR